MSDGPVQKAMPMVVKASNGNPATTTITVMLFWVMFNVLEAHVEALIFGQPFKHWGDAVCGAAFIIYAGYVVTRCAEWHSVVATPDQSAQ